MYIMIASAFLLAAIKWGDWKNWERYYPTYLFMVAVHYVTSFVTFNHTLWHFHPGWLLPNHASVDLLWAFAIYPATLLLYLPYQPKKLSKLLLWVGFWVIVYSLIEQLLFLIGLMYYENGWSLPWSIVFNIVMFSSLSAHFHKPVRGLLLAILFAGFVWFYFGFSINQLKP